MSLSPRIAWAGMLLLGGAISAQVPAPSAKPAAEKSTKQPALCVGDPAPKLSVEEWLLGDASRGLARERISVVVVCHAGQLRESLTMGPILELRAQQAAQVDFVVTAFPEKPAAAAAERILAAQCAAELANATGLRLGFDRDASMSPDWIGACGFTTTPYAFALDRTGRIAWRGRPKDLARPLTEMVAGTWDVAKERARSQQSYAADVRLESIYESLGIEYGKASWEKVLALCDEAVAVDPKAVADVAQTKTEVLLRLGRGEDARRHLDELRQGAFQKEMVRLYFLVEPALEPPPGVSVPRPVREAARACMLRARELGKGDPLEPNMLDRLACAHASLEDYPSAIECQARALELVKGTEEEAEFARRLARYRELVAGR